MPHKVQNGVRGLLEVEGVLVRETFHGSCACESEGLSGRQRPIGTPDRRTPLKGRRWSEGEQGQREGARVGQGEGASVGEGEENLRLMKKTGALSKPYEHARVP